MRSVDYKLKMTKEIFISGFTGVESQIKSKPLRVAYKLLWTPIIAVQNTSPLFKLWLQDKLVLSQAEIALTTRCSLRCRDCSNLMQYYEDPQDVSLDMNLKAIDRFFEAADHVVTFLVIGGEPLLYPDLHKVLEHLFRYKNKLSKIRVITNGTLFPEGEALFHALKNPMVTVGVSNYGFLEKKREKLIKLLQEQGIKFENWARYGTWVDNGDLTNKGRSEDELNHQFVQCGTSCKSMLKGKLHFCPRSSSGVDLGYVEDRPSDYVNLLDGKASIESLRKQLYELYSRKTYIAACKYCNKGTDAACTIPAARQCSKGETLRV